MRRRGHNGRKSKGEGAKWKGKKKEMAEGKVRKEGEEKKVR